MLLSTPVLFWMAFDSLKRGANLIFVQSASLQRLSISY